MNPPHDPNVFQFPVREGAPVGADPRALAEVVAKAIAALKATEAALNKTAADMVASNHNLEDGVLQALAAAHRASQAATLTGARVNELASVLGKPGDPAAFARASSSDLSPESIEAAETGTGLVGEVARQRLHIDHIHKQLALRVAVLTALGAAPSLVNLLVQLLG
jgi:hypothetical protein